VRGSKDRAKDASSSHAQRLCGAPCMHFVAHADDVPLLGVLRTSAVIGARPAMGGYPSQRRGPTEAFVPTTPREECRFPDDQDAFHRHEREGFLSARRDGSLRPSLRLSRSRRPHFGPDWEQVFWKGIARSRSGHPLSVILESADTFVTRWDFRAWELTTQARHRARPNRPSTRTVCLARTDAGRSA
jgi:hypothetical protein